MSKLGQKKINEITAWFKIKHAYLFAENFSLHFISYVGILLTYIQ